MIITCKKCNTSFNLDASLLDENGSKVRCSVCKNFFYVYPPESAKMPDTFVNIPASAEINKEPAPLNTSNENLQSSYKESESFLDFDLSLDEDNNEEREEKIAGDIEDIELSLDMNIIEDALPEKTDEPDVISEAEPLKIDDELNLVLESDEDHKLDDLSSQLDLDSKLLEEANTFSSDELDLSDIENMLEINDELNLDENDEIEDITLELDNDYEEEILSDLNEDEKVEDFDLTDLENILGIGEESAVDDELNQNVDSKSAIEIELEMDQDIDEKERSKDQKAGVDFEKTLELDMLAPETMLDITESDATDNIEELKPLNHQQEYSTTKIEFDSNENNKANLYKNYASENKDDLTVKNLDTALDQNVTAKAENKTVIAEKQIKKVQTKKVNKPVLILLILALIAGVSYGAYTLMESKAKKIPYISDFFKSQKADATGALKIKLIENTISNKYYSNIKTGELFVIKGSVRNDYDHLRSFIKVKATLFSKDGVSSKDGAAYCGNMLSDLEIENLELNNIKKRLMNRNGDRQSNVNLKQGATLPFMMVFSNLPDNINILNVEIEGSAP